jgi:hypothetical protein
MEDRVKGFVFEGTFTWTMTTAAYKFYTLNLLTWLKKAGVPWRLCIICCDTESYTFFQREGVACVKWDMAKARGQQRIAAFGTEEFKVWNRAKLDILRWIAEKADEIGVKESLYLDGDIIVCQDPWKWISCTLASGSSLIEKSLWFQCDCAHAEEHGTSSPDCRAPCSGVIYARHTGMKETLQSLYTYVKGEWLAASEQDQPYITNRLENLSIPFGILPRAEFGNGHWQKSMKWAKTSAWILLHYNYRVGDTKKAAMKTYGHWLIPY